jgi:hypothetical protein
MRIFSIVLLLIGEALSITAEMIAAHQHSTTGASFSECFLRTFPLITAAGACLIVGYILGYRAYSNIWVVTAISIVGILLMEPVVALLMFGESPTRGASVGLALGGLGLIVTLVL